MLELNLSSSPKKRGYLGKKPGRYYSADGGAAGAIQHVSADVQRAQYQWVLQQQVPVGAAAEAAPHGRNAKGLPIKKKRKKTRSKQKNLKKDTRPAHAPRAFVSSLGVSVNDALLDRAKAHAQTLLALAARARTTAEN